MPSYTVHLDRRYQLTGTYGAGNTTWTLPFADPFANCLVVGETHADTGKFYTKVGTTEVSGQTGTFTVSGATVTITGIDYSSIPCVIGTLYTMSLYPTRPFSVDSTGAPDPVARVQVHGLDVSYHLSAGFDVVRTMTGRTSATRSFVATGAPTNTGVYRALLNGNTKDATWYIQSTSPKRVVIPSIYFHTDANDRRKV